MIIYKHPKTQLGWVVAAMCIMGIVSIYYFRIDIHLFLLLGLIVVAWFSITYQVRTVCVYKNDKQFMFTSRRFRGISVIYIGFDEVSEFKVDKGHESGGTVAILRNGKVIDLNIDNSIGAEIIKVLNARP
jgi:hypothetical protein